MKLPLTIDHINAVQKTGDISKETLKESAAIAVADLGELSAKEILTTLTELTALEEYIDNVKKLLKAKVTGSDVELTGSVHGAKIVFTAVSTKYDYANDFAWQSFDANKKNREEILKNQLSLYEKHIANGGKLEDFIGIVESSGAQVPIISKSQTNGVKITLGK